MNYKDFVSKHWFPLLLATISFSNFESSAVCLWTNTFLFTKSVYCDIFSDVSSFEKGIIALKMCLLQCKFKKRSVECVCVLNCGSCIPTLLQEERLRKTYNSFLCPVSFKMNIIWISVDWFHVFKTEVCRKHVWKIAVGFAIELWHGGSSFLPPTFFSNFEGCPSIFKDEFSSGTDTSIFTSIAPQLLDWSNETSWVFPALKSTSHFLPSPQCLVD